MSIDPGFTSTQSARRLTFGIYPGGIAGTATGLAVGPPDDPERIHAALDDLQGQQALLVRAYVHYSGSSTPAEQAYSPHPADAAQYAQHGRKLDLVLSFRDPDGDVAGWLEFIQSMIAEHSEQVAKLQITEEPNLPHAPGAADGSMPNVRDALVGGVLAAKEAVHRLGYDVQVGFNAVPSFNPEDDFWPGLGEAGPSFVDALDYIGLDFFPDVFRPVEPAGSLDALREAVTGVLTYFRNENLTAACIPPAVPIHITENGWPTGPKRSYERQAAVLETIVRTVYEQAAPLNITHYELFSLRDADSSRPDLFYQFGLLRDDYTPKPAYEVYRQLIAELGMPHAQPAV